MRNARVLLVVIGSALTGALIAGPAAAETANMAGQVTAVAGPVTVTRVHVSPQPVKFRDALYWRDVVDAHKGGIARALLAGKMTVTVRELSRFELREEKLTVGTRYAVELLSGKVRATVARMLMRPDDQVEVRTHNAVSSVRGTDFVVQTISDPTNGTGETVVVTLSGVVEVSNRLAGTGRVERIGPYEAVRVSGTQAPVRFQVSADEMEKFLKGLTPPRPEALGVGHTVEATSLAVLAQSLSAFTSGSTPDVAATLAIPGVNGNSVNNNLNSTVNSTVNSIANPIVSPIDSIMKTVK